LIESNHQKTTESFETEKHSLQVKISELEVNLNVKFIQNKLKPVLEQTQ
jgi:hypothetical protein